MNKQSRKTLAEAVTILTELADAENVIGYSNENLRTMLSEAESLVTTVADEEREKFDNMPEGLQASPTGEAIGEAADALEYITWPDLDDYDRADEDWAEELAKAVQEVLDEIEGI